MPGAPGNKRDTNRRPRPPPERTRLAGAPHTTGRAAPPLPGAGWASGDSWGQGTQPELHLLASRDRGPGWPAGCLTKGRGHGLVQGGLAVAGGQVGPRVVPALVVVVLDVEAGELREVDAERAAGVVDVLPVQRLRGEAVSGWGAGAPGRAASGGPLTSLACWALTGSAYCSSAWNWLFLVNVMIFRTVPNLEKICREESSASAQRLRQPQPSPGPPSPGGARPG